MILKNFEGRVLLSIDCHIVYNKMHEYYKKILAGEYINKSIDEVVEVIKKTIRTIVEERGTFKRYGKKGLSVKILCLIITYNTITKIELQGNI